jgi:hypothetical protein
LEISHNGEPPVVDVERPIGKWPWGRQTGPAEALLDAAEHRARVLHTLTPGRLGV